MMGTFISVLKAERAEKQRAVELLDRRPHASDSLKARFREQIAELDKMVAQLEARR